MTIRKRGVNEKMPGFLSHYIAGKAAQQGCLPEIREKITANERLYNLGTVGPDIFFYYVPGQILKRSRGIAQEMHLGGLGLFIGFMAQAAKESAPRERDTIFAYTAGFLMHYLLDVHVHPYVYARSFNKNSIKIKNSAKHRRFETGIDTALLDLMSGGKPAKIKQWELINAEKSKISVSAGVLSQGISEIYNRNIPPETVCRALKFTINATKFLQMKDIKRDMILRRQPTESNDYLNTEKSPWSTPWSPEIYSDSFMERYQLAVDEGIQTLEAMYGFVYESLKPVYLAEKLGNRSLKTGMQCA
jgi:hypothetical protein